MALLLIGAGVGLVSSLIGAWVQHHLSLRADRIRRERDREERAAKELRDNLIAEVPLRAVREALRQSPGTVETMIIRPMPKAIGFLVVKHGRRRGATLSLSSTRNIIGRGEHNDIVLDDEAVSVQHAVVLYEEGDFYIQDLGSVSGTFVNEEEITKCKLSDGDQVRLGEEVLIFKTTRLED